MLFSKKKTHPEKSHGAPPLQSAVGYLSLLGQILGAFNRGNHAFHG